MPGGEASRLRWSHSAPVKQHSQRVSQPPLHQLSGDGRVSFLDYSKRLHSQKVYSLQSPALVAAHAQLCVRRAALWHEKALTCQLVLIPILDSLVVRLHGIQASEGIGPLIALATWKHALRDAVWLRFIDNIGALRCLVKGGVQKRPCALYFINVQR